MKVLNRLRGGSAVVFALALVILWTGVSHTSVRGQASVDTTFNAVPSSPITANYTFQQAVQPDGKILIMFPRIVSGNRAQNDLFRLNADGSLDDTFNYCKCGLSVVSNFRVAPDGKIYLAGNLFGSGKLIRLNNDGSYDPAFGTPNAYPNATFQVESVQPDGRPFVTSRFSNGGFAVITLYRFATDGTQDQTFTQIGIISGSSASASVRIEYLPDGRFYLAVTSGTSGTTATLTRRNANGSIDSTWETPSFTSSGFPQSSNIADIAVGADGSVFVAGRWDTVNGADRRHVVKLFSAGNVDLTFTSPAALWGSGVEVLPDGKVLYSANIDVAGIYRLFRYNADGSSDGSYTMDAGITSIVNTWSIDASQRTLFLASTPTGQRFTRLLSTGAIDLGFNPDLASYGTVNLVRRQSDGKFLVAGTYSKMNGTSRNSFSRVNTDGTLDVSFDAGTGFGSTPNEIAIQVDGKILAVGSFTTYNGTSVPGIVRLNTNGTIDGTFTNTPNSSPSKVAIQADGKILIGGSFTNVNGTARTGLARLNSDGSLDATFNPVIGSPAIRAIAIQTDGCLMIGGTFSGVNGFSRSNLVRLNGDGTLDSGFTTTVGPVTIIRILSSGKYLLGVEDLATSIIRKNTDGTADSTFTSPTFGMSSSGILFIHDISVRPDGSILVGGRFDTVGTYARPNLTRLAPNGSLDVLFPIAGTLGAVRSIETDGTSKVVVGGEYSSILGTSKAGIARLEISQFRGRTLYDYNGDGRADFTVYRPSTGTWYELMAGGNAYEAPVFGIGGDIPVPADYDGDGKTDEAIFRESTNSWWISSSINGAQLVRNIGTVGDKPMPGDFDGDGKADAILFRPTTNQWLRAGTLVGVTQPIIFGTSGDQAVLGDFDGDGKVDPAIFRPSTGDWWYAASSASNQQRQTHWGATGDIPVPADFDGDGKTDFAVFRPSNGAWYVYNSANGSIAINPFGVDGDRPVAADYDGDGRADLAVFRPSNGIWYISQSTSGFAGVQWGVSTDVAIPSAFLP